MKTRIFQYVVSLAAVMALLSVKAIEMQADVVAAGGAALEFATDDALVLKDSSRGEWLFSIQGSRLLMPDFAKDAALVSKNAGDDGALRIEFAGGALDKGVVTAIPHRRGFLVRGEFTPKRDVVMNRLEILPAGTTTLFYEINNYRNMQATDQVWTRTILGAAAFSVDTYSKDWQFAPHPSAMLFTRNDTHLLVGTTSAPVGGYGLYANGGKWRLDWFYLHYGDGEWGWKIRSGETWKTPEFYFAFDRGGDVHQSWKLFSDDLVADGRMFSSEPGCYDLDGVKTDYQADKIHFDLPAEDPAWRGEETYFRHLYALFTSEMRKYKPDAQHCGCAGNWFLAEYMDLNRTYDVAGDNPREHENRAKMLMATAPGVLPVYDMQHFGCRTTFAEWLASAHGLGVPVHVGNLFEMNDDEFSGPSPMTADDFEMLRKGLVQ